MKNKSIWIVALLIGWLLAGCIAGAPPDAAPAPTPTVDQAMPPALEESSQMQITELTLDGNGPTLLSTIDDALRSEDEVGAHRFIEFAAVGDVLWQGEAFDLPGRSVYFLQQAGDPRRGLRIDSDAPIVPAGLVDLLAAEPLTLPASPSFAEINFVRARQSGEGVWSFDVTLSHPDTGWDDYADGWHVATPDGRIIGTRILLHPHVGEQPFTRSLSGVMLGDSVDEVVIRAHDLVDGYGPETLTISLAERSSGEKFEVIR